MPTPMADESRDEFIERCIPMVIDDGTAADNEEAVAVCQAMYDERSDAKARKRPSRKAAGKRVFLQGKSFPVIAISAPVSIIAAEDTDDDEEKKPPTFDVMAYTGVAMDIAGYDLPLVIDLQGVSFGKSVVANLDHKSDKRVGHVTDKEVTAEGIRFKGIVSADTEASREVVTNAKNGYPWQASVEAYPGKVEEVPEDEEVEVNGQTFAGPIYVARTSKHTAFAFVSHGADENTTASIAATAAKRKEKKMDSKLQAWIEATLPGTDIESLTPDAVEMLTANYNGKNAKPVKRTPKLDDGIAAKQAEQDRKDAITEIALKACDSRPYDMEAIKSIAANAIDEKWTVDKFRLELLEAAVPPGHTVIPTKGKNQLNDKVLEAAVLMAGRHPDVEKQYPEQVLEAANKRFRHGIGLKELFVLAAQANGYNNGGGYNVDIDVQRAAFRMVTPRGVHAAADFSTISLPNVFSNVANKFLRMGWDAVDQTPLRIAAIRPVNDFKEITTVSLTGGLLFQEVGPGGELTHGSVGEETYGNKVKTRGILFSITRENIINDDLGALTQIPKRIGRGGMLTLNHVFWTEFLNPTVANFWHSNNANVNTGVANMTVGGLSATEVIFMNQTDPDGNPMLTQPAILLVPTALKADALTLMSSERLIDGTGTAAQGDANIWRGRFRVESSPYMSNSAYTGFDAAAWYMLADPNDIPVIEIAALNGRIEPTVETADADFNVLGVRMRGYDDIGVRVQEPRGGVRADGGSS